MAVVTSPPDDNRLLFAGSLSWWKSMRAPSFSSAHDLFKEVKIRAEARTVRSSTPVLDFNSASLRRKEHERNSRQIQAVSEIEEVEDQNLEEINSVIAISPPILPTPEKIYVAVGKDLVESVYALQSGLQCVKTTGGSLTLLHVLVPAHLIPTPVGRVPANQLSPDTVAAYRKEERDKANKFMDKYSTMCSRAQVKADTMVVEKAEVPRAIVELVSELHITKLIMGTTSASSIAKKMKMGQGKADYVQKHASDFCEISVVCKGKLLHVRKPIESGGSIPACSRSAHDGGVKVAEEIHPDLDLKHVVSSADHDTPIRPEYCLESEATNNQDPSAPPTASSDGHQEGFQASSPEILLEKGDCSEHIVQPFREEHSAGLSDHDNETSIEIETLKIQLKKALKEAENAMKEMRIEAEKRKKAESDAVKVIKKMKDYEACYKEEAKQKEDARSLLRMIRQQSEEITRQRDEALEQLETAGETLRTLELQVNEALRQRNETVQEVQAARQSLATLTQQNTCILQQRDDAIKQLQQYLQRGKQTSSQSTQLHPDVFEFREFDFEDLKAATCNFSDHLRIGEGCYGTVYKGEVHDTSVEIKILNEDSLQGRREFQHEIALLSTVRHPHLVRIVGICSDRDCIVYEYMRNGSLEDRLFCKDGRPPLPWHERFRIAAEICSALLFLHTTKPEPIVHCNLKPENVLLDLNYVSKISGFGLAKLIPADFSNSRTMFKQTEIKGTFPYTDPDYQRTGEFTPRSDVYSLGIVLLQLLTGKPAFGVSKDVERALESGKLEEILDRSAGEWPFVQATQLANLALHCTEMSRKNRPDLHPTVMQILDQLRTMAVAASSSPSARPDNHVDDATHKEIRVPSFFLCPIFHEIMHDPRVAADGFTYECEAIKGWFDSGHDTSPMTNVKLTHKNLIPNHSLRSAIRQWQDNASNFF